MLSALVPIIGDSVVDALPMVPVLFVLYAAFELLSHREGVKLLARSGGVGALGPIAGALLGVIPQCGMSVFMTSLYRAGRVSSGTLVATYIATSDEALPVLIAQGAAWRDVGSIVAIKAALAVAGGLVLDRIGVDRYYRGRSASASSRHVEQVRSHLHRTPFTAVLMHALRRTVEVFGWVVLVSVLIGLAVHWFDGGSVPASLAGNRSLEVVAAAIFGLIPNCAVSVAIAEGYLRGGLSYAATVAGLSAGAGYGPIVLFKEGDRRTAMWLMAVCLAISITGGLVVSTLTDR